MDVILNIGLARNGNSNIGSGTVIREVIGAFGAASFEFKHSDTELTCIVSASYTGHTAAWLALTVGHLSRLLGQDCIALWVPRLEHGALIGPRADKWGAFNPEFFLMPDGSRLSDSQPAAKAA